MEKITSKFAQIQTESTLIQLYDACPPCNGLDLIIEDVTITIDGTILKIQGNQLNWDFFWYNCWVDELENKPEKRFIKYRYKNIINLFKGIKSPCVNKGWNLLEKRIPYHATMSQWFLSL